LERHADTRGMRSRLLFGVLVGAALTMPAAAHATTSPTRCAGTVLDGGNLSFVASSLRSYRADATHTLSCGNARRVVRTYFRAFVPSECAGKGTRTCAITVRGLGEWGCYLVKPGLLSPTSTLEMQCEAHAGWTLRWRTSTRS
jgi:hypothetical protein